MKEVISFAAGCSESGKAGDAASIITLCESEMKMVHRCANERMLRGTTNNM